MPLPCFYLLTYRERYQIACSVLQVFRQLFQGLALGLVISPSPIIAECGVYHPGRSDCRSNNDKSDLGMACMIIIIDDICLESGVRCRFAEQLVYCPYLTRSRECAQNGQQFPLRD